MPMPKPGEGEALVRVRAGGICGSDMHIYHGTNPLAKYPRIIGREFSGEIESLGPGVQGFSIGDRVAVAPVTSCGTCYACSVGRRNVCESLEGLGERRRGAEVTANTKDDSLEEAMGKWTGGKGIPLIIDAVGIPDLFPVFLRMASPAGRIGLLGFSKAPSELVQLEVVKKELSIYGSRLNRNKFPEVISWFEDGSVEPELLVSHRYPFEKIREAMEFIQDNPSEVCKVILEF